jgi:hypothetical protein
MRSASVAYIVLPGKYSPDPALHIVLSGKRNPLTTGSQVAYLPPRERSNTIVPLPEHANHRRSQGAWRISSRPGRYIVLSGKFWGSPVSSCPGNHTVLAGKLCRPARELTSSCGGRYIVFPGKIYRPAREMLSSSPGNWAAFFAANVRFSPGKECERPVFVCVNCLLCF